MQVYASKYRIQSPPNVCTCPTVCLDTSEYNSSKFVFLNIRLTQINLPVQCCPRGKGKWPCQQAGFAPPQKSSGEKQSLINISHLMHGCISRCCESKIQPHIQAMKGNLSSLPFTYRCERKTNVFSFHWSLITKQLMARLPWRYWISVSLNLAPRIRNVRKAQITHFFPIRPLIKTIHLNAEFHCRVLSCSLAENATGSTDLC